MSVNSIVKDFDDFVSEITINKTLKDDIISKNNSLGDMIKSDSPDGYSIVKTRLSGSYAKHTVLKEYDDSIKPDVDMIVVIDNDYSVEKIFDDFLDYFKSKKGNVTQEIRQQSNSIGIIYQNISVDIVIAKMVDGVLYIAGNKKNEWIQSNALVHVDYMEEQNSNYEINYYSLMKLFKYVNKNIFTNKIKSFTLEMLIHQTVPNYDVSQTLPQMFKDTLGNILLLSSIYDLKDCSDITKKGYDEKDVVVFNQFIEETRTMYNNANRACNGERYLWESIFGDRFPKQPENKVENNNSYSKNQTPWCLYE